MIRLVVFLALMCAFSTAKAQETSVTAPATSPAPEGGAVTTEAPDTAPSAEQKDAQTVKTILATQPETQGAFRPSYGKYKNSLFFSPATANSLMQMISLFESGALKQKSGQVAQGGINEILKDLNQTQAAEIKPKPVVYPRFRLRSVIYRSPAEWAVLVNDTRISAASNQPDRELVVLHVSQNGASFKWKPSDETLATALHKAHSAEASPASDPSSNKSAKDAKVTYNRGQRATYFALAVNQEFDAQSYQVVEGRNITPSAPPATASQSGETMPSGNPEEGGMEGGGETAPGASVPAEGGAPADAPQSAPSDGPPAAKTTEGAAPKTPLDVMSAAQGAMDQRIEAFSKQKSSPKAQLLESLGLQQ